MVATVSIGDGSNCAKECGRYRVNGCGSNCAMER